MTDTVTISQEEYEHLKTCEDALVRCRHDALSMQDATTDYWLSVAVAYPDAIADVVAIRMQQLQRARYVAQFGRRLLRIVDPDMFDLSTSDVYELGWRGGWNIAPAIRRYHRAFDRMGHHD